MYKKIICSGLLAICAQMAFAEDRNEEPTPAVQIVPLVQYDYVSLASQKILSTSAGVFINSSGVQFVGLYTWHKFDEPLDYGFPRRYHAIDTLLEVTRGRHQYIGIFQSKSDLPISGGINTYQGGAVYGYELLKKPNMSLVLGGGIAFGNFGIETPEGNNWPLIPVPLLRMNYQSQWLDTKFEFITSPNLSLTLAPKDRIRLTGDFRLDQLRDSRDIIYEVALAYRPYSDQDKLGDFAGVSIGIKNDSYGAFNLGNKENDESLEIHYKALFAAIDISVLKVTAGYAYEGRTLYRETEKENMGDGYFLTVQGMYAF